MHKPKKIYREQSTVEHNVYFIISLFFMALPIVLLIAFILAMIYFNWFLATVNGICLLVYGLVVAHILEPAYKKFWKY